MHQSSDDSYLSLHRELAAAIAQGRYRLALSLLDLCEARAVTHQQRCWIAQTRGSVESALRIDER